MAFFGFSFKIRFFQKDLAWSVFSLEIPNVMCNFILSHFGKYFWKTIISCPLMHANKASHQGLRSVSFLGENFANVLYGCCREVNWLDQTQIHLKKLRKHIPCINKSETKLKNPYFPPVDNGNSDDTKYSKYVLHISVSSSPNKAISGFITAIIFLF